MNDETLSALRRHGWAQLKLLKEYRARALAAPNPQLCLVWAELCLKFCKAMTETGDILARFRWRRRIPFRPS